MFSMRQAALWQAVNFYCEPELARLISFLKENARAKIAPSINPVIAPNKPSSGAVTATPLSGIVSKLRTRVQINNHSPHGLKKNKAIDAANFNAPIAK